MNYSDIGYDVDTFREDETPPEPDFDHILEDEELVRQYLNKKRLTALQRMWKRQREIERETDKEKKNDD